MRFPWSKAPQRRGTVAVINVGSGSVAVAILEQGSDHVPSRVLSYTRAVLKQGESSRDSNAIRPQIIELVKKAIQDEMTSFHKEYPHRSIAELMIAVHAPWATSMTKEAVSEFPVETEITDAMVASAAKSMFSSANHDAGVFERAVVRVEVNGYPTAEPAGKRGGRLRVVSIESTADPDFVRSLNEAAAAAFGSARTSIRSSTYVHMTILQPFARGAPRYSLVDVASEATSFLSVREGSIAGFSIAPTGWRGLIRSLAEKYKTTPEEAFSRFKMVVAESCDDRTCGEVLASLGNLAPDVITAYGRALTEASKTGKLPSTMVLVAPPEVTPWFAELLTRIDFAPFSDTGQAFSVQLLLARHLTDRVTFSPGLTPDGGVAASAAFMHTRARV